MKTKKVLISLTEKMLKDIDGYIEQGLYVSRSEFFREATRGWLYTLALKLKDLQS